MCWGVGAGCWMGRVGLTRMHGVGHGESVRGQCKCWNESQANLCADLD